MPAIKCELDSCINNASGSCIAEEVAISEDWECVTYECNEEDED